MFGMKDKLKSFGTSIKRKVRSMKDKMSSNNKDSMSDDSFESPTKPSSEKSFNSENESKKNTSTSTINSQCRSPISSIAETKAQSIPIFEHSIKIEEDTPDNFPLHHVTRFDLSKIPLRMRGKIIQFQQLLSRNEINVQALKDMCLQGIPEDCAGLRSIVWRIVLGYLPKEKSKWNETLASNAETYRMLVDKYVYSVVSPSKEVWEQQDRDEQEFYSKRSGERPESFGDPKWSEFFKSREFWIEIEKDTTRTRSEMHFFVTETNSQKPLIVPFKQAKEEMQVTAEKHFDVLSRILFVYGQCNPGVRYVQGMNEILAIFYHVFSSDQVSFGGNNSWDIEADCFFCFTILMAEVRDCFLKVLDDSDSGIKARIASCNERLQDVDEQLWQALENIKLNPHFYSLRWLMLIFTQEFEIFDVMRLWDTYLAHENRQEYLDFICIAILQIQREYIIHDFAEAMHALQRISHLDVVQILSHANQLYRKFATKRIISFS